MSRNLRTPYYKRCVSVDWRFIIWKSHCSDIIWAIYKHEHILPDHIHRLILYWKKKFFLKREVTESTSVSLLCIYTSSIKYVDPFFKRVSIDKVDLTWSDVTVTWLDTGKRSLALMAEGKLISISTNLTLLLLLHVFLCPVIYSLPNASTRRLFPLFVSINPYRRVSNAAVNHLLLLWTFSRFFFFFNWS